MMTITSIIEGGKLSKKKTKKDKILRREEMSLVLMINNLIKDKNTQIISPKYKFPSNYSFPI